MENGHAAQVGTFKENGHVIEVVTLMEGERSCYRGGV